VALVSATPVTTRILNPDFMLIEGLLTRLQIVVTPFLLHAIGNAGKH
jgi:hypothetical protein